MKRLNKPTPQRALEIKNKLLLYKDIFLHDCILPKFEKMPEQITRQLKKEERMLITELLGYNKPTCIPVQL